MSFQHARQQADEGRVNEISTGDSQIRNKKQIAKGSFSRKGTIFIRK
jgi:hypothetical protein